MFARSTFKELGFFLTNPKELTKTLLSAFVVCIPIVNFAVFGYFMEFLRQNLENVDAPLPDWSAFGKYFGEGCASIPLLVLLFSPCWISALIVVFCISAFVGGAPLIYVGGTFAIIFFSLIASFSFLLGIFVLTLTCFRYVESDDVLWGINLKELSRDLFELGWDYQQNFLESFFLFCCGELLFGLIIVLKNLIFPWRSDLVVDEILFALISSFLFCLVTFFRIKKDAILFQDLHYRYK